MNILLGHVRRFYIFLYQVQNTKHRMPCSLLTSDGLDGFLSQFRYAIVLEEQFFEAAQLSEGLRRHPPDVAIAKIQANQLWYHFKGICFHLEKKTKPKVAVHSDL